MNGLSVLFLGKEGDAHTRQAIEFLKEHAGSVEFYTGTRLQPLPVAQSLKAWDLVVSYLSPWVVPPWLLARAEVAAINFHPGPPEYPGIGCTNFAIYNGEKEFGVTCHHMEPRVDRGRIIAVRRFPLQVSDTVYSLTHRCYEHIFMLFKEVMAGVLAGKPLPEPAEQWKRVPYTRAELDALCAIKPDMDAQEIQRRVRATSFPGMPGAYVVLGGEKFLAQKSVHSKD